MKMKCPYCKAEFGTEVEQPTLGQVQCPNCHKTFVPSDGTPSSAGDSDVDKRLQR